MRPEEEGSEVMPRREGGGLGPRVRVQLEDAGWSAEAVLGMVRAMEDEQRRTWGHAGLDGGSRGTRKSIPVG